MATLQDFRNERLRKLDQLKKLGVNPYPAKSNRTNKNIEVKTDFEKLEGKTVSVVGRIKNIRKMGKIGFVVIKDESDSLQLFLSEAELGVPDYSNSELGFSDISLLDSGDFVEGTGEVIKTQTGEISVKLKKLRILTKALRPMPLAHEEFSDKEQRLRRRYIDTNVNQDVHDRFVRRSKFWQETRNFLLKKDFLEVNTPILEHTTGGADANPFVTHMDALDQDFYLRISHELPLKRLLGGGYEKVFDIGPRFRNENYSDEHLPEHVAMEWYWAYADWQDGMKMMEEMFQDVLKGAFGTLEFEFKGKKVDMGAKWEQWDYAEVIKKHYGINVFDCTIEEVAKALKDNKLEVEKTDNIPRGIDKLWKKIRKDVVGPVWLINTPAFISPLSKASDDNPDYVQRFQAVIMGSELANGWSELNDPIDQLNRFLEQQKMRDSGDDEAQMLDIDYVEMLEYGMPPACGLGFSERVFWLFEGVTAREGVIFPNLRPDIDETTKKIYPEVKFDSDVKLDEKDVPESADKHGTYKIYLNDWATLNFDAKVISVGKDDDGVSVVLDQTAFYPMGGGQACDLGSIEFDNGAKLELTKVSKDEKGLVHHHGDLSGDLPGSGAKAKCKVDAPRRLLNSRLHCAGHFIDYAVRKLNKDWKPGKGAHYPEMSFVEYSGTDDIEDKELFAKELEAELAKIVEKGGKVSVEIIPSKEVIEKKISDYIPEAALKSYKAVHVVSYPDNFKICCGGTHVQDVSDIGEVKIRKVKKKDGNIRISYDLG